MAAWSPGGKWLGVVHVTEREDIVLLHDRTRQHILIIDACCAPPLNQGAKTRITIVTNWDATQTLNLPALQSLAIPSTIVCHETLYRARARRRLRRASHASLTSPATCRCAR